MSIVNIGGIIGSLMSGYMADKMGRKGACLLNNAFLLIGTLLMTGSKYVNAYPLLVAGRTVMGIGCGGDLFCLTSFLREIFRNCLKCWPCLSH